MSSVFKSFSKCSVRLEQLKVEIEEKIKLGTPGVQKKIQFEK